jgi:hypothetical protein
MKRLFPVAFLPLMAFLCTSCAYKARMVYHAGDETPPEFLAGPSAVLLTNIDGFSANVSASAPARNGKPGLLTGDLLEREGRLVFQPSTGVKGKHKRSEGGMFFIWHEDRNAGFVLSDPLQAYAPIVSNIHVTNIVWNTSGAVEEPANGHSCRRVEASVQSDDGSTARYSVWQAEDLKHCPVRIAAAGGGKEMTVNLNNVRLELPAPELFYPPEGFTKYETPATLMNELIMRQSAFVKSQNLSPGEGEPVPAVGPAQWRPTTPQ